MRNHFIVVDIKISQEKPHESKISKDLRKKSLDRNGILKKR